MHILFFNFLRHKWADCFGDYKFNCTMYI